MVDFFFNFWKNKSPGNIIDSLYIWRICSLFTSLNIFLKIPLVTWQHSHIHLHTSNYFSKKIFSWCMSISAWNISLKKDKKNCLAHNIYICTQIFVKKFHEFWQKQNLSIEIFWMDTVFSLPKKNGQNCAVYRYILELKFEKKCNFDVKYLFVSFIG